MQRCAESRTLQFSAPSRVMSRQPGTYELNSGGSRSRFVEHYDLECFVDLGLRVNSVARGLQRFVFLVQRFWNR